MSGIYTDAKCSDVYEKAVKHIEEKVNSIYEEYAEEINKEIDELKSIISPNQNNDCYSSDDIKHLAIGAGAGLGAAIIFGGPVGWLVGIGAAFAAAYNSSQKKEKLN